MDSLEGYIREGATAQEKWQRLLDSIYAGYLTMDVANYFIQIMSEEDKEFGSPAACKEVDIHAELIEENHVPNEFLPPRKLILDYGVALKYLPECRDFVWHKKDKPDNCHGYITPNNKNILALSILEEYGFIRIGSNLVSRTVQPVIIQGPHNELLEDTITIFPSAYGDTILHKFPCMAAVGGGFVYFGLFERRPTTDYMKEEFNCTATTVLKCVGRPKQYMQPYPYDIVNYVSQIGEYSLYS